MWIGATAATAAAGLTGLGCQVGQRRACRPRGRWRHAQHGVKRGVVRRCAHGGAAADGAAAAAQPAGAGAGAAWRLAVPGRACNATQRNATSRCVDARSRLAPS
eukprot:scaffold3895_cov247-Prasinococcus_capsulatus_cf.AAC.2